MCAGAMLCDGNRDELYKQRGIRGSLKASVPNKSYKEPERERGCHNPEMKSGYVRGKADWTEMGSVCRFFCCFFPFLGTGSSGSPTSHSLLFRSQFACLLFLAAFLRTVCKSANSNLFYPLYRRIKSCFTVNC